MFKGYQSAGDKNFTAYIDKKEDEFLDEMVKIYGSV